MLSASGKKIESLSDAELLKKFEAIGKYNIKFEIRIYKRGNNIILETEMPKDLQFMKYSNEYDIDTLKHNKFLSLCETIDDIIDTIYENASSFPSTIQEKEKDYELKIPVPIKSIKEITFILKENEKQENEIINDLCLNSFLMSQKMEEQATKIEQHNTQAEEQYQKIEEQNKKIAQLEMRIAYLEEQNKNIRNELKEILKKSIIDGLKKDNNNENEKPICEGEMNPILIQSSGIIKDDLFKQLNIWINPSKSLKFDLIYTASLNGDNAKDFHNYCDGKGPSLILCEEKYGHVFGAYLTVPFSSDNKVHYDDKAFLFSLTNKKKFPIKIKEQAVCHYESSGPFIGKNDDADLGIRNKCLQYPNYQCHPNSYEFKTKDLIGTEIPFFLIEYEVFLVN